MAESKKFEPLSSVKKSIQEIASNLESTIISDKTSNNNSYTRLKNEVKIDFGNKEKEDEKKEDENPQVKQSENVHNENNNRGRGGPGRYNFNRNRNRNVFTTNPRMFSQPQHFNDYNNQYEATTYLPRAQYLQGTHGVSIPLFDPSFPNGRRGNNIPDDGRTYTHLNFNNNRGKKYNNFHNNSYANDFGVPRGFNYRENYSGNHRNYCSSVGSDKKSCGSGYSGKKSHGSGYSDKVQQNKGPSSFRVNKKVVNYVIGTFNSGHNPLVGVHGGEKKMLQNWIDPQLKKCASENNLDEMDPAEANRIKAESLKSNKTQVKIAKFEITHVDLKFACGEYNSGVYHWGIFGLRKTEHTIRTSCTSMFVVHTFDKSDNVEKITMDEMKKLCGEYYKKKCYLLVFSLVLNRQTMVASWKIKLSEPNPVYWYVLFYRDDGLPVWNDSRVENIMKSSLVDHVIPWEDFNQKNKEFYAVKKPRRIISPDRLLLERIPDKYLYGYNTEALKNKEYITPQEEPSQD